MVKFRKIYLILLSVSLFGCSSNNKNVLSNEDVSNASCTSTYCLAKKYENEELVELSDLVIKGRYQAVTNRQKDNDECNDIWYTIYEIEILEVIKGEASSFTNINVKVIGYHGEMPNGMKINSSIQEIIDENKEYIFCLTKNGNIYNSVAGQGVISTTDF